MTRNQKIVFALLSLMVMANTTTILGLGIYTWLGLQAAKASIAQTDEAVASIIWRTLSGPAPSRGISIE